MIATGIIAAIAFTSTKTPSSHFDTPHTSCRNSRSISRLHLPTLSLGRVGPMVGLRCSAACRNASQDTLLLPPPPGLHTLASKHKWVTDQFNEEKDRLTRTIQKWAKLEPILDKRFNMGERRLVLLDRENYVYIHVRIDEGKLRVQGECDHGGGSDIAKGASACLLWILNGALPREVLELDDEQLVSPLRSCYSLREYNAWMILMLIWYSLLEEVKQWTNALDNGKRYHPRRAHKVKKQLARLVDTKQKPIWMAPDRGKFSICFDAGVSSKAYHAAVIRDHEATVMAFALRTTSIRNSNVAEAISCKLAIDLAGQEGLLDGYIVVEGDSKKVIMAMVRRSSHAYLKTSKKLRGLSKSLAKIHKLEKSFDTCSYSFIRRELNSLADGLCKWAKRVGKRDGTYDVSCLDKVLLRMVWRERCLVRECRSHGESCVV